MRCFIFLTCVLACAAAMAAQGWNRAGKVTRIHSGHHSGGSLLFSTETQFGSGCDDHIHGYVVANDPESAKRIYAILLLAYSTGKSISIYLTGTCINGRPGVDSVQINDTEYF